MIRLDIHCGTCHRDGDPNPPRFARFIQRDDGRIDAQPLTVDGQLVQPYRHERPDGGYTWLQLCPQGHDRPVQEDWLIKAFDAMATLGRSDLRITL